MKKYITKLGVINILKKKRRTKLSLISILLTTAIVYTSLVLFVNISSFTKKAEFKELGNFHYAFYTEQSFEFPSRYSYTKEMDIASIDGIVLKSIEINNDVVPFNLIEGRYPKNNSELLVEDLENLIIGDNVTFEDQTYDVVGIYTKTDIQNQSQPTYYTTGLSSNKITYYLKDKMIEAKTALSDLVEIVSVNQNDIVVNTPLISNEVIKIYMEDPTNILLSFVIISILSMFTSLISIKNVILISDDSRKKELGLLKSIGLKPTMVKYLIKVELILLGIIGASLGIGLGLITSYMILQLFIDRFYITFNYSMIIKPTLMIVSLFIGISMMYIAGMKAYKKYIYTLAVEDLKEVVYSYENPKPDQKEKEREVSWDLFLIYNRRMEQQTSNIRHSFILLLVATVLFMSVTFSNLVYKNKYNKQTDDFIIRSISDANTLGGTKINYDFVKGLYELVDDQEIEINQFQIDRLSGQQVVTKTSIYNSPQLYDQLYNQNRTIAKAKDKTEWTNLFIYTTWLDEYQLKILDPYIVEGSYEDLIEYYPSPDGLGDIQYDTYIAIYVDQGEETLWDDIHSGEEIATYNISGDSFTKSVFTYGVVNEWSRKKIAMVIKIPEKKAEEIAELIHMPLDYSTYFMARGYQTMAMTHDSLVNLGFEFGYSEVNNFLHDGYETYYINLKNEALHIQLQNKLDKLLVKTGAVNSFEYINYPAMRETLAFSTFIVDVLFYPLFFMLFIASLLNIYNVFNGNLQLKRNDISIMKSIGMKTKYLKRMFIYEYLEGYINASALTSAIFMVAVIALRILKLNIVVDWENTLGALIYAILALTPFMILPILLLSLKMIKKILPIENSSRIE